MATKKSQLILYNRIKTKNAKKDKKGRKDILTSFDINVNINLYYIPKTKKVFHTDRGIDMKEMHLDLEIATNFLVQFFYRTGRRYSCTRTKVGKMLAIAAFEFARKGIVLFDESVVKYGDNCGAVINGLAMLVDRDAYLSYEYVDIKNEKDLGNKVNFLDQEENTDAFIPENYKKTSGIPEEVQICIKKVFSTFGGCSAPLIGRFMNDLIYLPGIINKDGTIDLERISQLTTDDVKDIAENRLVRYLFS